MKISPYAAFVNDLCKLYIKKKNKIFDCGAGDGFHTAIVKKYSNNVIAGDFDNRTKKEYGIRFRKIWPNKYGKKNEFDVVTSFDVIEHVKNDLGYLKALINIIKPGGLIILGTPNKNRLSNRIISLIKGKITYPYKLGYHYESGGDILHLREYTQDHLVELSKKAGGVNIVKIYSSFLGLYVPLIDFIGLKWLDVPIFKKSCHHLYIVLQKNK